jgi:hypothetical protein
LESEACDKQDDEEYHGILSTTVLTRYTSVMTFLMIGKEGGKDSGNDTIEYGTNKSIFYESS